MGFNVNIDQIQLFSSNISNRLFRRFPGSKIFAAPHLVKLIPRDVKEIVSPFIGGGGFELFLTCRDIKVHAYDKFEPLVNCWQYAQKEPKKLSKYCQKLLLSKDRDEFNRISNGEFIKITDPFERAAYYWLLSSIGWNGTAFRGCYTYTIIDNNAYSVHKDGSIGNQLTKFSILENFYNPNITVKEADYKQSLEEHSDLFAYCDPPYPKAGDMYGNSKEYHSEFNHEELAEYLLNRKTPWMLSYSNHPLIEELYPKDKCIWLDQWWRQPKNVQSKSKEVVILSKPTKGKI